MEKKLLRKAIDNICCEQCRGDQWCLLKEIIIHSHDDTYVRFLSQLKCIEIFKLVESEKVKHDIGWAKAWSEWVNQGFAEKFGELYDPEKDPVKLYYEVTKRG